MVTVIAETSLGNLLMLGLHGLGIMWGSMRIAHLWLMIFYLLSFKRYVNVLVGCLDSKRSVNKA